MRYLLILVLLLSPSLASAAYLNQAEVLGYEQDQNGAARLKMRFTGNAGEEIVDRMYAISASTTFPRLRNWIEQVVTELNIARTAGTAPQVAPGTVVNGLTPSVAVPTAKSVWRSKVQVYIELAGNGFTGSLATALSAMKADIEATYQSGFLDAN
jgi:hypothetical protein